jgi:hypothetical protein
MDDPFLRLLFGSVWGRKSVDDNDDTMMQNEVTVCLCEKFALFGQHGAMQKLDAQRLLPVQIDKIVTRIVFSHFSFLRAAVEQHFYNSHADELHVATGEHQT